MIEDDIFNGLGVEIKLSSEEDFLKIVETLTRVGVLSKDNTLTQTCHVLHKRGRYAILHFKELFKLDGVSKSDISDEDVARRNGIVNLLAEWKLCTIKGEPVEGSLYRTKIISHRDKHKYDLKKNYTIGNEKSD